MPGGSRGCSHPETLQLSPRCALARGDHQLDGAGTRYVAGRRDRGCHEDIGMAHGPTVMRGVDVQATRVEGMKAEPPQQGAELRSAKVSGRWRAQNRSS